MQYTPSQFEAISTTDKNLLIIAGPGSGKTHTLVGRVIRLIENGVAAENIMVATFSEKAAKELITRVSNRLIQLNINVNLNEMYIGTLHSIFLRIIEEFREFTRLKRSYRLLDDFDQKFFVFRNLNKFNEINENELVAGSYQTSRWERVKNLLKYIGIVSEENLDFNLLKASNDIEIKALGNIYELYTKLLEEENLLDFSAIQSLAYKLLNKHPDILSELKSRIQYLMIDEYQDTNTIQEKIILLLSNGSNLCVVGDDDQGLYRFRGATIRNILEFKKNFAENTCHQVVLETNYRSHQQIIKFYNDWMIRNTWTFGGINYRYNKQIAPPENQVFENYPAVIKVGASGNSEDYYEEVYQFITHLVENGHLTDYNQITFLCKSVKNDKIIALANYLEERNIPIFSPRSALFFERTEIKLLLGAIIFIFPNLFQQLKWSDEAQLAIWDNYTEWRNNFVAELQTNPTKHQSLLHWLRKRAKQHLTLDSNTTYGFAALLYQLLEYPMFSEFLENVDLNGQKNTLRAAYNIALLSKLLYKFEYLYNITVLSSQNIEMNLRNLFNTYLRFIIEGGIEEYEDFDEYAPEGCLSMMTIHQSKGLEFPVVMTGSLNLVPREQQNQLDLLLQSYYEKPPFEPSAEIKRFDFWRLFYTAFSRPQNLLVLTAQEKSGQGKCPSKYFEPIYSPLPDWRNENIEYSKIKFESVKPVNLKHEYSFTSHILLYENCPLQYKFYKDLEFVEVRTGGVLGGSLLHQTIEDIHKAVLRGEEQSLTNENITQWFNTNYFLLSKQQRAYLHQAQQKSLLKQILRYRDNNQHQWDRIKEAEVDVSLVKDSYILKGTIDLIKGENNTVELIDFKSGDKPDVNSTEPNTKRILQQYRRQLEVYAHLVEERTGNKVSKMHLYYPKEENSSPYISFRSNTDHIQATIESFDKVVSKIEAKDFDMTNIIKSEKQCGNCDMRFHCNPKHYST